MRVITLFTILVTLSTSAWAHGGGLNSMGCHKNNKTGDYHCHRGNSSSSSSGSTVKTAPRNEASFNLALAALLNGQTEVKFSYDYGKSGNTPLTASVRIDIVTEKYVIEGGLDKRSSLDSIQQAVFASTLSGKEPAVAVYDTDEMWGKFEQRIWTVANQLGIKFFWFDGLKLKSK